jgi:hypothetical protein
MLVVERSRRAGLLTLLVLALVPAATLAQTEEPVVVRLNDAVGDTLDRVERDSFHLFPNTTGFRDAVVLALPGPEFYARITRAGGTGSATPIFLRIMPIDLERIRFLIDNHESVVEQQRTDSAYAQALASFWHAIEDYPFRNMAGEPAIEPEPLPAPPESFHRKQPGVAQEAPVGLTEVVPPAEPAVAEEGTTPAGQAPAAELLATRELPLPPAESAPAGASAEAHGTEPGPAVTPTGGGPQPKSIENRYNYTLHGLTCGSATGGCVASHVAIKEVGRGGCSPLYTVDHPLFWTVALGFTALGTSTGYLEGRMRDANALDSLALPLEGKASRIGYALGALVPGLALGAAFLVLAGASHYGKTDLWGEFEHGSDDLTILPVALTGVCIAVEVTTIGYRIGRAIDRRNAEKAEARRRALGH